MEIDKRKVFLNLSAAFVGTNRENEDKVRLWTESKEEIDMEEILDFLGTHILDPTYTDEIGARFNDILLLIATKCFPLDVTNVNLHQQRCIALAKLIKYSTDIQKFSLVYFTKVPSPFEYIDWQTQPRKKHSKNASTITSMDMVDCCYTFLKSDTTFFKNAWKWSQFIEIYCHGSNVSSLPAYRLICNHILALLFNMSEVQLQALNNDIPTDVIVDFQLKQSPSSATSKSSIADAADEMASKDDKLLWNFTNDTLTNVEGVTLPLFDRINHRFFVKHDFDGEFERIVRVDSTKINLRSLALGVAAGKAICLAGPVGSGKTTLVEYLARRTGRIAPRLGDVERVATLSQVAAKENTNMNRGDGTSDQKKSKRKRQNTENKVEEDELLSELYNKAPTNGFLRIQLGDQTDSKMLLGQYRCTDVPGEFVWQPGVLTQAVMNGYWLLLEDLDSCTQDVCSVLTNLLENNYLSVPGFRDCLRITSGFQLFITLRTQRSSQAQIGHFQLLEKYLYTINILPLSRNELSEIICQNYPKLATIAGRIVNVFLKFSSGGHTCEADATVRNCDLEAVEENNGIDQMDEEKSEIVDDSVKMATNSGRLVSTRDLLKLCRRSSPTFNVTSTECADFVFKNAVDLFCSHLSQGPAKTELITSIGAHIGINPSKCVALADEYKPDVAVDGSRDIRIGRVVLMRRTADALSEDKFKRLSNDDINDSCVQKKIKIDANSHLNVYQQMKRKTPTFSFTRLASCILERIAVAVQQNEPVLLVGETGVGKTSSVQYLSYQTNHKLVVINMNNQSDVSDLVGGFKPVDLTYVMAPLRSEFEALFKQTFNVTKNEKFLNNISVCYNQGDFNVLIKLMLKIVETAAGRKTNNSEQSTQKNEKVKDRWNALHVKLLKLNSQLKNSINISFAFITGSLVNCIKNGDWVLLDEINLASSETLECLSTILEPDGSIVLLEKGDFLPVKRHPDFRLFACMNPSTDIGKKDLPVGIRNRFTEFFVDELITENDLMILVADYLNNTGIQKTKVLSIVKLYRKLRSMAQLELNDGLGNRPVYSLRTLCRALTICAKNLCGSVERNLYESFCLSFLTQLDPASHLIVLDLIQKSLLSNKKAILSQAIPKPPGDQLNFEGYWIQQGPNEPQPCENYILTESVKENLRDLARIISIGKLPVLLQGPTSAGKTSLIEYVAKRSGNYCLRINNHEHTDLQEYIGTYTADVSGKLSFKQGVLVQAMKNGYWIILDELNLAPSDILEALNRVLDDNRELFIPETQELIKAHPNFMLFATQNPPGLYGGRKTLSRAFKNRFIELHFSEIPKQELEIILEQRCLIPKSYAQKMVKTMSELQVNRKSTAKGSFTLRDLFRWGNRYTFANRELLKNNAYDWNQHLVDEGYLVLSSKIRNENEVEIIETALFNNFRKKIVVANLFDLHDRSSMVTQHILQAIAKHPNYQNIVWTFNMRRMAILTAKALEFNEPVLLVGQTGCGKTTICQILADIAVKNLRILNCHMHTEGADFLGGLRPYRGEQSVTDGEARQLFEWANGPLILSMLEGGFFLADEISLAEDSVLERLNCVLEPERTILLAEKGGCNDNFIAEKNAEESGEFVIKASNGFQFLATMNPGGDFGKKELSPALRNRFTEIWCRSIEDKNDLIKIAAHSLKTGYNVLNESSVDVLVGDIAAIIVNTVSFIKNNVDKFTYSIRDILAWVQYITKNSDLKFSKSLSVHESILFGLETMFLDSLEMLPHDSLEEIERTRSIITKHLLSEIREKLQKSLNIAEVALKKGEKIEDTPDTFGIRPFYIAANPSRVKGVSDFLFTAPTTQNNLFRLLSAMSLNKSVLLEGPPGVGKTSLIENLAAAIGYNIVRINLCEHTDLADLFGTDQPADSDSFELGKIQNASEAPTLGSFVWRDGPLLAALKAPSSWILLDELNLAPQSVLEGLNAILDHRGEVFIPELNKTFKLGTQTRIFASQNPLRQGGGRKGLPQSFLNRFTKVYLRKLDSIDLCHVINGKYSAYFKSLAEYLIPGDDEAIEKREAQVSGNYFQLAIKDGIEASQVTFDLCDRLVEFSERLDKGIHNLEFGHKGGPFEVNLRDILRWCNLISNSLTGFKFNGSTTSPTQRYKEFIQILYEKMKLVYYQRMRSDTDKSYIRNVFSQTFNCDAETLETSSLDISLFWNNEHIYFNDVRANKTVEANRTDIDGENDEGLAVIPRSKSSTPIILTTQRDTLRSLTECVIMEKPVILCGPSDSGKTKVVDVLCTITNQYCNVDTIDDSVTGSFQQIDLNRHLEEISQSIESILVHTVRNITIENWKKGYAVFINLLMLWEKYNNVDIRANDLMKQTAMSDELIIFKKRLSALREVLDALSSASNDPNIVLIRNVLAKLQHVIRNAETLNTGGHFEWVDSKFVRALKIGQYICLEHVNLCSSAILDRLNPVFEPNGSLLLSEKGVSSTEDNQSECVRRNKRFRAFLTLDPKNGEISRAMRNRCIELNFNKESYSDDDLKQLVYENGIKEVYLIEWLLRIHHRLRNVTEFSTFNVSHLMKFAFLTSQNLRLGTIEAKAVFNSALEVYVRSSHTDLLGYGLLFYRNKLIQEISEELQSEPIFRKSVINFENTIVRASDLSTYSLVRLQFEPFLTAVRCLYENVDRIEVSNVFQSLRTNFHRLNIELSWKFTQYLLYVLYEIGSKDDNDIREVYTRRALSKFLPLKNAYEEDEGSEQISVDIQVGKQQTQSDLLQQPGVQFGEYREQQHPISLSNPANDASFATAEHQNIENLLKLNTSLHSDIQTIRSSINTALPWNQNIFTRLCDYTDADLSTVEQLKLSALLLTHLALDDIHVSNTTKLSQINALTYSKAVANKLIPDSLSIDLITYLHSFIVELQRHLSAVVTSCRDIQRNQYVDLLCAVLWCNRLQNVAQRHLFKQKTFDDTIVDSLTLHFRWLDKFLLAICDEISSSESTADFSKHLQKLTNYVRANHHPLNRIRKAFVKTLTLPQPFYDEKQVQSYDALRLYENTTSLNPKLGKFESEEILKRLRLLVSEESSTLMEYLFQNAVATEDELNWLRDLCIKLPDGDDDVLANAFKELRSPKIEPMEIGETNVSDDIKLQCDKFIEYCNSLEASTSSDLSPYKFIIEILPVLEYFALRALNAIQNGNSRDYQYNLKYFQQIKSIGLSELSLLKTVSSEQFKTCERIWNLVCNTIMNGTAANEGNELELLQSLPAGFYKTFSSFVRSLTHRLQSYALSSTAVNSAICYNVTVDEKDCAILQSTASSNEQFIGGPLLTNSITSILLDAQGNFKSSGLGDLDIWRNTLKTLSNLLWNNIELMQNDFSFERTAFKSNLLYGRKLMADIELIQSQNVDGDENAKFIAEFQELIEELRKSISPESPLEEQTECETRQQDCYRSSIIVAIIGSIELNLLTFMPLLDPVEKNRLKKAYVTEDQQHLSQLIDAYEFMRINLNYEGLGRTTTDALAAKRTDLQTKFEKYSKKCALRPQQCVYSQLAKDVSHFLRTCCHPATLLSLLASINASISQPINEDARNLRVHIQSMSEIVKRIEMWISNAQRFEHHTLKKYATYYRDFVAPIETSISNLKFGLMGLKHTIISKRDAICTKPHGHLGRLNDNGAMTQILSNLIGFPNVDELRVLPVEDGLSKDDITVYTLLDNIDYKETLHFMLIKSKLQEIHNKIVVAKNISADTFSSFDAILNVFNEIWKKQEDLRRKKAIEEESLYVNKVRCATEDEEEAISNEIEQLFPNHVEDDFGEFIQADTLEQVTRNKPSNANSKKLTDILLDEDIKLVCEAFVEILQKYARSYYFHPMENSQQALNLIAPYQTRVKVFHQIINKHRTCQSSLTDDSFYGGMGLIVGALQNNYQLLDLSENVTTAASYNFYKDPNIPEIVQTTDLLKRLEARVLVELQNWPDHAVLNDIIRIIQRIRSLPSNASVVRFSTGFQILRQKVDEWNSVAHKLNHMRELEVEIAQFVQRWTKLELQCWRECLSQSFEKLQSKAYRYWFFIFNLLHEYLQQSSSVAACDLTDFKAVEKCFGENEVDIDVDTSATIQNGRIKSTDVINVLKQFIESSNYAEFGLRMRIVQSFELYLQYLPASNSTRRESLIAIIHNIHLYYTQFVAEIDSTIKSIRTPIEKKLKEFVKIESYNKDLSYFSMKNNIARVHRHLHKFLREFETALSEKIATVFAWKANQTAPLTLDQTVNVKSKPNQSNIAHMIDVKNFIASPRLKDKYVLAAADAEPAEGSATTLLARVDKLFSTSRSIVKQAILHSQFPGLLYNLDVMLTDQIETCEYLRKLEVDRSQEKPKQKGQAKQILQQKRKALADAFKTLSTLGLSYRSGILETSLNTELVDLKIAPFCVPRMITDVQKHKRIDQSLTCLNEHLDAYYSKCVYKLNVLQKLMLTPSPELGLPNLERIKGFSVDMFLLVQSQRKALSKLVIELHDLQKSITNINELQGIIEKEVTTLNFGFLTQRFDVMEIGLCQIVSVMEQYSLLLKCAPDDEDTQFSVISSSNIAAFTKSTEKFKRISAECTRVLDSANGLLKEVQKLRDVIFLNSSVVDAVTKKFQEIRHQLQNISADLLINKCSATIVIGKPLKDLLEYVDTIGKFSSNAPKKSETAIGLENHTYTNIESEIENIIHFILLSMQNIYKKYSIEQETMYEAEQQANSEPNQSNDVASNGKTDEGDDEFTEDLLQPNHLKNKIHQEMQADLANMNIAKILSKINNILLVIQHADAENTVAKLASARKIVSIVPILEQFDLLCKYYLVQQFSAHKVSAKMLSVMLTIFIELGSKGFCIPPDLMQDEDGESKQNEEEQKNGEGFGLEDGTGENDVSDKIESEDQLDTAQKPGDDKQTDDKEDADCKEEKGIDMSEDFDSKMQDVEKKGESDESDQSEDEEDLDKQMGETEDGADKLDDQIWGSDEEKDDDEESDGEMNDEEEGKGSKEENEEHNDLDSKNDNQQQQGENEDGLDAANDAQKEKKKKEKDIDEMQEPDVGEDQVNPYHNELEEPPQPEDMDLDNLDLDNEEGDDKEENNEENPFDIDTMKENMEIDEDGEADGNNSENEKEDTAQENVDSESESDDEGEIKRDENNPSEENIEPENPDEEQADTQKPGEIDEPENENAQNESDEEPEPTDKKMNEDFQPSKDKASEQDNVQAMPENKEKGSTDQVQIEKDKDQQQETPLDEQDTGEDKDGIGQAENDESKTGHQGIADTKDTQSNERKPDKKDKQDKRKQGATDEERTISEKSKAEKKQLKTVDKLSDEQRDKPEENETDEKDVEAEEYQHVKDAQKSDKTTMDNATDEQSKKIQHEDDHDSATEDESKDVENSDELLDDEVEPSDDLENVENVQSEKNENEQNKDKKSKSERTKETCEANEEVEVEGEIVPTYNVPRKDETSAHLAADILQDSSLPQEPSTSEVLDMRKMYENERLSNKMFQPQPEDFECWQTISNKMLPNARELCEQLRLILEPTKCTRLKGDYRTGRRINMKKIIPYIASQFRKDKIWLRRTKPAQRDYKITIAIDDSRSMDYNNSKTLTLQAISLVSQALTLLESGRLSVVSFGESPQIVLNYADQFDGPKLVNALSFAQNQSRIAELLEFVRVAATSGDDGASSDNGLFENLLLILSDGRNIFSEGEQKVKNAVKLARLQRIFVVYIIIDNPENKHSILDIRVPFFAADKKTITMKSYLDTFPFPYYVIVRDLAQLPMVLSDAMRQWFELVSSEQ